MSPNERTRYELPADGTSLLGYIARRMHKTGWLVPVPILLAEKRTEQALAHIALYAVTASTSYGRAYYQPRFDSPGEEVVEPDPETGVPVRARLLSISPTYRIGYSATLPDGSAFTGNEEISRTTVGLRGLGMPAPSKFSFRSGNYSAELSGILTSELALSLTGHTRIRAYGFLNFMDSADNAGALKIDRAGAIALSINGTAWAVDLPFSLRRKAA